MIKNKTLCKILSCCLLMAMVMFPLFSIRVHAAEYEIVLKLVLMERSMEIKKHHIAYLQMMYSLMNRIYRSKRCMFLLVGISSCPALVLK